MFGDTGAVLSLHRLIFGDRLSQRPITSDEVVPIVAAVVVEQKAEPRKGAGTDPGGWPPLDHGRARPAVNHSATVPKYVPGMDETRILALRALEPQGDANRPSHATIAEIFFEVLGLWATAQTALTESVTTPRSWSQLFDGCHRARISLVGGEFVKAYGLATVLR
jgi:hypothetical protein